MKGDFSRRTFEPIDHYSRVLLQQGRVLLDSDWNEQVSILLHQLRSMIADFRGPCVAIDDAFTIADLLNEDDEVVAHDFSIAPGHLYVDGILCENEREVGYKSQPDRRVDLDDSLPEKFLVFVDVWERHLTHVQEDSMREVALGGVDTSTRAAVVWQARIHATQAVDRAGVMDEWDGLVESWQPANRGLLRADTQEASGAAADNPCIVAPESEYRGAENQLYRVEIHRGGPSGTATFKWSRDNGSVVFPLVSLPGDTAKLESLGRDARSSLQVGSQVELHDDFLALEGKPGPIATVESIDEAELRVTLRWADDAASHPYREHQHPLLRRWDHVHETEDGGETATDGALILEEGVVFTLEDGITVEFVPPSGGAPHQYRTGDYWLIPARTATGGILWPSDGDTARALPPRGVRHHFAPLALVTRVPAGLEVEDCVAKRVTP